jgi:hypothetical protein
MSFLNGLRIALSANYGRWFDEAHPEGPLVVAFPRFGPTGGGTLGRFLLGKAVILFEGVGGVHGQLFFGYAPNPAAPVPGEPLPQPLRVRTDVQESAPGVWTLSAATYWSFLVGAEGHVAVTASLSNMTGPSLNEPDRARTATLTITGDRQLPLDAGGFNPGTQRVRFDGTLNYTTRTLDGRLRDIRTATDGVEYAFDGSVIGSV